MHIERLVLSNFRCFGPGQTTVELSPGLTALVGVNGSGKTAVMQAMQRMFGVTSDQRSLRRQDFHVPAAEDVVILERTLVIEAIIAFPELDGNDDAVVIPEFFRHMAATEAGQLKCRLRIDATWSDDGTLEGSIDQSYRAVRTFGEFLAEDVVDVRAQDRTRIQLIYVPATRDGASQVTAFLRGRLWRAINWSQNVRERISAAGAEINSAFAAEAAITRIASAVTGRWQQIHTAGTDTTPFFRPVTNHWQDLIAKVEIVFRPDEAGRERALSELSDGQRSLFHLAMVAATLDVESQLAAGANADGFQQDGVAVPALTIIGLEEPENNLAPFYLSRIIAQVTELTGAHRAQAVVSSHSPSILARIEPTAVRHFRCEAATRTSTIRSITLPAGDEEAAKFVREAVRTYPELYFARFVLLGEGATEEVVLPRIGEALDFPIDRSFVAIVPLGGRHVNHLWKLLNDLQVPHATLLDLDWGRSGGGWGRIKNACKQLIENGIPPVNLFGQHLDPRGHDYNLASFDTTPQTNVALMGQWITALRRYGVFFAVPLDLDHTMLKAYSAHYQVVPAGLDGPSNRGDPREAVLGPDGQYMLYPTDDDVPLRWYRYLFLGRGKPSTHVRVLNSMTSQQIRDNAPDVLAALIAKAREALEQL
jgi:putative ATP-dependent endonuclease of the OLD family